MRTSVIAALALSLLLPAAASATPAAEARFFFERGQRHYERGRYGAAAEDFLLSYESAPSSGAIYNAAVASARARRPADEFSFLQVYLRLDDHDRERRQTARARIAELEATLAIVRVETSPPGATSNAPFAPIRPPESCSASPSASPSANQIGPRACGESQRPMPDRQSHRAPGDRRQ